MRLVLSGNVSRNEYRCFCLQAQVRQRFFAHLRDAGDGIEFHSIKAFSVAGAFALSHALI